jgi:hypothetical protein
MTCIDYQIIVEKVPNITDEERLLALLHISGDQPCHDCIDRQKALGRAEGVRGFKSCTLQ